MIDCCFIERGAWVLVDYKTDADAAGAIERHRPQLELYAQALAGITGRPVRERVLYLVRAGMGVSGVNMIDQIPVAREGRPVRTGLILNLSYNPRCIRRFCLDIGDEIAVL